MLTGNMGFIPQPSFTPRMQRQLIAIERTVGILSHLRWQPELQEKMRKEARVIDTLASVRIEGGALTYEQAFNVASRLPGTGRSR